MLATQIGNHHPRLTVSGSQSLPVSCNGHASLRGVCPKARALHQMLARPTSLAARSSLRPVHWDCWLVAQRREGCSIPKLRGQVSRPQNVGKAVGARKMVWFASESHASLTETPRSIAGRNGSIRGTLTCRTPPERGSLVLVNRLHSTLNKISARHRPRHGKNSPPRSALHQSPASGCASE